MENTLVLTAEQLPSNLESQEDIGDVFIETLPFTLGRSSKCDLTITSPSVSRNHLRIDRIEGKITFTNLSKNGSTYINRSKMKSGEQRNFKGPTAFIQVGDCLFKIENSMLTIPYEEPLSLPEIELKNTQALITIRLGLHPTLEFSGTQVPLFPMAHRVLWMLSKKPSEIVTNEELMNAMTPNGVQNQGGLNINQNITYVRNSFNDAINFGLVTEEQLTTLINRARLRYARGNTNLGKNNTRREILRTLVENIRGVGYRLNLPKQAIEVL